MVREARGNILKQAFKWLLIASMAIFVSGCGGGGSGTDGVDAVIIHSSPGFRSIEPDRGSVSGATWVTIIGNAFMDGGKTIVTFGGLPASQIKILDATRITCITPAHDEGSVDVTVKNDFGAATLTKGYAYEVKTEISGVTPGEGPVEGGTSCTITGGSFTTSLDTTITFGGAVATNTQVVDETTITCDAPPHHAQVVDVTVASSNGTDTLANAFIYRNLDQVVPDRGSVSGGTQITIQGSEFTDSQDTLVVIGGVNATNVTVVNSNTITCVTPPCSGGPGPVDVYVENSIGYDTLVDGFTYAIPPTIASVAPEHGGIGGGTSVTISGANFTNTLDTTLTFGGAQAQNLVVVNATTLTCETPMHAAGAVDLVVTNSNGSGTLTDAFTYHDPPDLISISPQEGPVAGGIQVTITGNEFTGVGTTSVIFGGAAAANVNIVSATTITCTTPAHIAGSVDVVISNPFGTDTLYNGFTFLALPQPPTVTGISPEHGPIEGSTFCTITGTGFTSAPDMTVQFGGTGATNVTVMSSSSLTCVTPPHASATVDIDVTTSNGAGTLENGFTYHDPPVVVSVTPNNGPAAGGTLVSITGSNFTTIGVTIVSFGGSAPTGVSVVSTTEIVCMTPAHSEGPVSVAVSNDFGNDILPNGFTYDGSPVISGVTPDHGSMDGGTSVTITGTGFTSSLDTTITFGGVQATSVVVVGSTSMTCITPAHDPGNVDVVVENSNGSDTLHDAFSYQDTTGISGLDYVKNGAQIILTWDLTGSPDEIIVFRGGTPIATIGGSEEQYTHDESDFGYFRFTVALYVNNQKVDQEDVLVEFGLTNWDPPGGSVSGYYLYVAEAIGDPHTALPYNNPQNYSYDAGFLTEAPLKALYDLGLIAGGHSYFLAASSYLDTGSEILISALTDPLTFTYEVELDQP